jgi:glycosyltransferase involved in cell wall biosynthesis
MTPSKRISIILLSYNDPRIAEAIESVRRFDDIGTVGLVVIDGGSTPEIRELIASRMMPDDVFVSEKDKGIFDALNKGMDRSMGEFIGWLGSDDVFSGRVTASEVVATLSSHDVLVAGTALVRGDQVIRVAHALPSRLGLVKYGLNNPHFSTFGRASVLKSERFEVGRHGADIAYFLKIFDKSIRVATSEKIATIMNEGGFSTGSYKVMLSVNVGLISAYQKHTNFIAGPFAIVTKFSYKLWSTLYYKIFKYDRRDI